MTRWLLLLMLVVVAGCVQDTPAATPSSAEAEEAPPLAPRVTLVDHEVFLLGAEWDLMCRSGGGVELPRSPARIAPGVGSLEVTVDVPPTYTSLQVGYSLDGDAITWLEPVFAGSRTDLVPVDADAHEAAGERWTFYYQLNLPAAPQDCYTGAGTGPRSVKVDALAR